MKTLGSALQRTFAALACAAMVSTALSSPAVAEDRFMIALSDTAPQQLPEDVIDAAAQTGQFSLFLSAVEAAGMEDTLRGEGPFTLLAPTDAAFTPHDHAELQRLLRPEMHEALLAFVSYHVVPHRVSRDSLHGRVTHVTSASGQSLTLDARDGLRVNDQLVAMPDIEAGNGFVQGMNAVIYPPILLSMR